MNHKTDMQAPTEIYVWFADNKGTERDGERFIRAWTMDPVRADGLRGAIGRAPAVYRTIEASQSAGVTEGWRELCRRLYVELFHCDQQMRSTRDQHGDPHWTQSAVVRVVLKDANAALAAAPAPVSAPEQPSERVEQDCQHGVDDGARKQCYGEATSGEQGAALSDEQRERVCEAVRDALGDALDCTRVWSAWRVGTMSEDDFVSLADDADRVAEIADAAISALNASAPTLGGGAAPWQGCKHRVCYKNGACWTAGKCLEPTEPEPWPTEIDAQIKACALMILGICATRPQDEWPKEIEGRIRYMLSKLQPQAAEPKGR